jgi:DNA-binding GntR family transcriptional regulator
MRLARSYKARMSLAAETAPADALLRASVYDDLRRRMITGKIGFEANLSTRGLAQELGVSQTPVRDALSRLAAEGAIEIRSKRRVAVPTMNEARFADLLACRLLLEPEAAALALPHIAPGDLKRLAAIDARLDGAIASGEAALYMEANFAFHFGIYRANRRPTLNRLIETLWLQFGPFMRLVYGRFGTANLADQHRIALDAIGRRDAGSLRRAIASDIADGMGLIGPRAWTAGGGA